MTSNFHMKNAGGRTPFHLEPSKSPKAKISNIILVENGCQRELHISQELLDFLSTIGHDSFIRQSLWKSMEEYNKNGVNHS